MNYLSIVSVRDSEGCYITDESGNRLPGFELVHIHGFMNSIHFEDLKNVLQSVLSEEEVSQLGVRTIVIERCTIVMLLETLAMKIDVRMSELSLPLDSKSAGVKMEYKGLPIYLRSTRRSLEEGSLATLIRFYNFCKQCLQNHWKLALIIHENADDLPRSA